MPGPAPAPDLDPAAPWPDIDVPHGDGVTVVYDGAALGPQTPLRFTGPPAGHQMGMDVAATLWNRSGADLAFDDSIPWLDSPGFTLLEQPPDGLADGASAQIRFRFRAAWSPGPDVEYAVLTVPIEGSPMQFDVQAQVPRPLAAVVIGPGGYRARSDDGGSTWTDLPLPDQEASARHSLVWGNGVFLHAWSDGPEADAPSRFALSDDGLTFVPSSFGPTTGVGGCTPGILFVCAHQDAISWSTTGALIVHEPDEGASPLLAAGFNGGSYIAVGLGGRRATSLNMPWIDAMDELWWREEVSGGDDLVAIACQPGGRCLAVGGNDRHWATVTTDAGATWTDTAFDAQPGARLTEVVSQGQSFFVSAAGEPSLYRTDDGIDWQALPEPVAGRPRLLGEADGTMYAELFEEGAPATLARSMDGVAWQPVHTLPDGMRAETVAGERWDQPAGEPPGNEPPGMDP